MEIQCTLFIAGTHWSILWNPTSIDAGYSAEPREGPADQVRDQGRNSGTSFWGSAGQRALRSKAPAVSEDLISVSAVDRAQMLRMVTRVLN